MERDLDCLLLGGFRGFSVMMGCPGEGSNVDGEDKYHETPGESGVSVLR